MKYVAFETKQQMAEAAAKSGAVAIREAIRDRGHADIIVATGASQFEMLDALAKEKDIPWDKVTGFHLDEYVGLSITHPASFRAYLWQRFVSKLPFPLAAFHYVNGEGDPAAECARLGEVIRKHTIDVAFIGIGENGHLAFNDPPADRETDKPYLVVTLDHACRKQQMGEGWFKTIDDVPTRAISMSVRQILKSRMIIVTVPDQRKAEAVRASIEGPVTNLVPGSALQGHPQATIYLDKFSASLLKHA